MRSAGPGERLGDRGGALACSSRQTCPHSAPNPNVQLGQPRPLFIAHHNEVYASGHDTRVVTASPAQLAAIGAAVDARFDGFQRQIYGIIAARIDTVGNNLYGAADALSGGKKLWESYAILGFPLSIEQDETCTAHLRRRRHLRRPRRPAERTPRRRARHVRGLRPGRLRLPDGDLTDVTEALDLKRADDLHATIATILDIEGNASVREGHELIGRTLRLQLLQHP